MKKIDHSDQANDSITHLQIELPLNISAPGRVYTPHPSWDSLRTDPYWDELEQELPTPIGLLEPSAPEQIADVLEQFSSLPQNKCDIDCGNKRHVLASLHSRSEAAPEHTSKVREQFYVAEQSQLVREQVPSPTTKTAPEHEEATHWVEKYWVKRSGNKHWYYRYLWMEGRKIHRVHIGSVRSPLVKERVEQLRQAMAGGELSSEIQKMILSWRTSHS